MPLDKVLSSSIANGAVTAALISNTANLVVSSLTANVITITTISGSANVTGDMTVGGNLTISGTTTYVNTTDLNIGDAIISLNADLAANVSPTEDAGININRGASTNAQFKWIESTDNWSLGNTSIGGTLATTSNTVTLGTAAYFVANGNVGMGTDSPAYRLDVNGDLKVVNAVRYFVGATQYGVTFANAGAVGTEAYQGTYIYWGTGASTSATERMRLDASGNLGVGTTSPQTKLHVYQRSDAGAAPNTPEIRIEHQDINAIGTGGSNGSILSFVNIQRDNTAWANNSIWGRINFSGSQPTGGTAQLGASILAASDGVAGGLTLATYLAFYTSDGSNGGNNTEKMRIDNAGSLLVGTTTNLSSVFKQYIVGGRLAVASNSNPYSIYVSYNSSTGGGYIGSPSNSAISFSSYAGNEHARFDSSGNLGIGETNPASKLHITASTAPTSGSIIRLDNSATTTYSATSYAGGQIRLNYTNGTSRYGGINFSNYGATSQELFGVVQNSSGYGDFVFQGFNGSGYTERMRINSLGDVGIGTTAPSNKLSVAGNISLTGSIFPSPAYSYSISTNSWSANTFYTIVTPGVLSNYTTYWVTVRWDHGGGGGPFIMAAAFMFSVINTNGSGVDNTYTPMNSSHVGGGGVLSFRSIAATGSTTGLQASASSIVGGTLTVNLYRFV